MAFIRKRGKVWYGYWYEKDKDGSSKQRTEKISQTKVEAEDWLKKFKYEFEYCQKLGMANKRKTIRESIDDYIKLCEPPKKSLKNYQTKVRVLSKDFLAFIKKEYLRDLDLEDFLNYEHKYLQTKKANGECYSNRHINNDFTQLSAWLNHCKRLNWIDKNPLDNKKKLQEAEKEIEYYSDEELDLIVKFTEKEHTPWIQFLRYTGSRIGEVTHAEISWIDFKRNIIKKSSHPESDTEWTTKTKKIYEVPIASKLKPYLIQAINNRKSGALFESIADKGNNYCQDQLVKICNRIYKATGTMISSPKSHKFRHTVAKKLLSTGKYSLEVVGKILGHSDIKTTQVYAQFLPNSLNDLKVMEDL